MVGDNPLRHRPFRRRRVGPPLATWASRRKLTQPPRRRRFGVQLSEINEGGHAIILRPGPQNPFDRETLYAQTLRTDHANVRVPLRTPEVRSHGVASVLVAANLRYSAVLNAAHCQRVRSSISTCHRDERGSGVRRLRGVELACASVSIV